MNKNEKIESEIKKTLKQFENVENLEHNPFLITRIQQKLGERNRSKLKIGAILKPAFFTLLFAINIFTSVLYLNSSESTSDTQSTLALTEILSSDLNLEDNESDILIAE